MTFAYLIIRLFGKRMKRYGEEINIYQKRYVENQLESFGIIKEIILNKAKTLNQHNIHPKMQKKINYLLHNYLNCSIN